jgi:hypothetical protein
MTHNNPDKDKDKNKDKSSDEPTTVTQEESVPSDGKDVEGEEMMKSVRNDQLKEPPPPPPRKT